MKPKLRLLLVLVSSILLFGCSKSDSKCDPPELLSCDKADLSGADLSGAVLSDAVLSGAKLSGVKLSGADLSGANLTGADLSGTSLSGTNLFGIIVSRAGMSGLIPLDEKLFGENFWFKTDKN